MNVFFAANCSWQMSTPLVIRLTDFRCTVAALYRVTRIADWRAVHRAQDVAIIKRRRLRRARCRAIRCTSSRLAASVIDSAASSMDSNDARASLAFAEHKVATQRFSLPKLQVMHAQHVGRTRRSHDGPHTFARVAIGFVADEGLIRLRPSSPSILKFSAPSITQPLPPLSSGSPSTAL